MHADIGILLYPDDLSQRKTWHELMAGAPFQVWDELSSIGDLDRLEILLVGANWERASAPRQLLSQLDRRRLAVIAFETGQSADVVLNGATSPRELQLACQLLAEVVRLRRQQQYSEQVRSNIESLALTDHLTGIANRRGWDSAIKTWSGGLLAVVDLDRFKQVNDLFGHDTGDQVLQAVAAQLRSNVRCGDLVARLGGDEFGLLLTESAVPNAFRIVDRIRASLTQTAGEGFALTASAGFAVAMPEHSSTRLFQVADAALRTAKSQGRNRTVEHS